MGIWCWHWSKVFWCLVLCELVCLFVCVRAFECVWVRYSFLRIPCMSERKNGQVFRNKQKDTNMYQLCKYTKKEQHYLRSKVVTRCDTFLKRKVTRYSIIKKGYAAQAHHLERLRGIFSSIPEKSPQSLSASHLKDCGMHRPLLHWNSSLLDHIRSEAIIQWWLYLSVRKPCFSYLSVIQLPSPHFHILPSLYDVNGRGKFPSWVYILFLYLIRYCYWSINPAQQFNIVRGEPGININSTNLSVTY